MAPYTPKPPDGGFGFVVFGDWLLADRQSPAAASSAAEQQLSKY